MEQLIIKLARAQIVGDSLYMEFVPDNIELVDKVMNGVTSPLIGTVAETVAAHQAAAAADILVVINEMYPGRYSL